MRTPLGTPLPPLKDLKYLWFLFGLGVLAMVATSVYLLATAYRDTLSSSEVTRGNLAVVLERKLDSTLRRVDAVLESVEQSFPHRVYDPRQAQQHREHIARELKVRLGDFPEVTGLRIWSAQGDLLHTTGDMPQPVPNIVDRGYFIALKANPAQERVISEVVVSRITGSRGVVIAHGVHDPSGKFIGIVSALVDLGYFERLFESLNLGKGGIIAVRRTDDYKLIMRWPPAPDEINQPLRPGHPNRELIEAGHNAAVVDHVGQIDNVRRLFNLQRLHNFPIYLIVGQPHDEVLADWERRLEVTLLIGFGLTFLLIWMVGRLVQSEARRHAVDAQIKLLASVFEHSGEAILITDAHNRIVEVNPSFTQLTGYAIDEVRGENPKMLASGRNAPESYATMWSSIRDHGFWQGELWDRHKDGHVYPKWLTISTIRDKAGGVSHYVGSFTDITERKASEERIHYLAHHDALTKLPNRAQLQGRLEQAIAMARRDKQRVAVMFIDMDHFKHINDSLGHHVGDGLLIEVAERLRQSVRDSDVVARLGGDEFVVVLVNVECDTVSTVIGKILKLLGSVYLINDHELHSTPTVGISLFPDDGDDVETLMKNADTAMYFAKAAGRNTYQFFTAEMNAAATERVVLEASLRHAIEREELLLHYQPQIDVATGRPCGVEALVRWLHPEKGMIPPLKFIPVAEETGLIVQLGEWVLDTALGELARWRAAGISDVRMAINLSAHQLRDPQLVKRIAALMSLHNLGKGDLELEITESVAMKNPENTIVLLTELRRLGIELAIDDFGTGYSSLAYLKQLPLDRIKLDRSFVMDIENDPNDAAISAATISLAHSLGLSVVAEGVETASQFDFLKALECDVVQGYFFSRPVAAAEAEAFLRRA